MGTKILHCEAVKGGAAEEEDAKVLAVTQNFFCLNFPGVGGANAGRVDSRHVRLPFEVRQAR